MSQSEYYLLFDSSCVQCSDLAGDIEKASGGALVGKSLYAREARAWLDAARPGWKFEPTLIRVEDDKVRAYTGMAMRAQMVTFLNPIQLLKIARVVQKAGVPLFGSFEERPPEETEPPADESPAEPAEPKFQVSGGFQYTTGGPEVGATTPVANVTTETGAVIPLTGVSRSTILLFLSTTCGYCQRVAEYLQEYARTAPEQLVMVFSTDGPDALREFIAEHHLAEIPLVISPETRAEFNVTGIPYAYALDGQGTIRGKGIVNNADHLDSLANTLYISVDAFKQALAFHSQDKLEVT